MKTKTAVDIITALLILLFLYDGLEKFSHLDSFRASLNSFPVVDHLTRLTSWLLPAIELFICLLLFWRRTRTTGLYAASGLLLLSTVYVANLFFSSLKPSCNCGEIIGQLTWSQVLFVNIVFTLLAGAGIIINFRTPTPVQESEQRAVYT